jgi:hypothetical protein
MNVGRLVSVTVDKRVVAAALVLTAIFGLAFGALLEGGGQPGRAASREPGAASAPARSRLALPTPTTRVGDRPSPDYGFADEVLEQSGVSFLVFDRADILVGAQAAAEAARAGRTVDPDGGYYVRNNNERKRQLRLAEGVRIQGGTALGTSGRDMGRDMDVDELAKALDRADDPVPVLLTYDDEGRVATVAETTLP